MEHPARDSLWRPRLVMPLACVAALFALGFALSAEPQQASAGGLPVPTVTLPGVTTVTLPTVPTPTTSTPPTTTTGTTTGTASPAPASPPAPDSPGAVATTTPVVTAPVTTTPAPSRSTAQVSGAKRLRSGAISIPISSVRAPARLRVVLTFVRSARVASVRAQVIDTRGFRVRGARVSMASAPVRALVAAKARRSAADGTAIFPVSPRKTARLHTIVVLTIRAVDPGAPSLANASRRLRLTIRGRS